MLKSPVIVTLCGCLLSSVLPASAYDGPFGSTGATRGVVMPRQMRQFVRSYIKDNDQELADVRDRSYQPFMIIDSVMDHYALPQQLRYLAVIESELRPAAVSRVGAKGPWQLMAGTARDLGLKVNYRSDERTNLYKSTGAAALYLRDLHREFKDWLLVLAAYNAGPAPVYRAIRLSGSRNFWVLQWYLPKETRQHVKRFLATAYYFTVCAPAREEDKVGGPAMANRGRLADAGLLRVAVSMDGSERVDGPSSVNDLALAKSLRPVGRDGGKPGIPGANAVGLPGRAFGAGLHEDRGSGVAM